MMNARISNGLRQVLVMMLIAVMTFAAGLLAFNGENVSAASYDHYVFDFAEILSDDEEEKLEEMCAKASADCETDFVIITTREGLDYTPMDNFLREFADESGFGYDVIVYGVDMVSRADRIWTRGKAQTDISQSKLDDIREDCEEEFHDGYFYSGYKKFVKKVNLCLTTSIFSKLTYALPIKILISLGVALISVLIMMASAKSRMTVASTTYTKDNQFRVNEQRDEFINTTVVTRKIESRSSSGGGGGGGNSGSGGHF